MLRGYVLYVLMFHFNLSYMQDYPADEILVVFDPDFKLGQNFYIALTEDAKLRILNVSQMLNL